MVVDTSAVIAILLGEPETESFIRAQNIPWCTQRKKMYWKEHIFWL